MKILYIMSVPWGWIKQRPHFIAEELSKHFQVEVCYKRPIRNVKRKNRNPIPSHLPNLRISSFQLIPLHAIPVIKRLNVSFLNKLLMQYQLPSLDEIDVLWVTSPYLFSFLKDIIPPKVKIIYDCMDDYAEFDDVRNDSYNLSVLLENEKCLLQKADKVFCSAEYLKRKVFARAGIPSEKALVVNNAIGMPSTIRTEPTTSDVADKLERIKSLSKNLIYVGTIAEWFDFDLILKALDRDKELHLILIGPTMGGVSIPVHDRIIIVGPIQRSHIFEFMECAFALIMPFQVIELIKSVNPVKLYEYIYTGKPVLAPRYGETEKFSDFVYLYDNYCDFVNILSHIEDKSGDKDYKRRCLNFIKDNTWENRVLQIINIIKETK